MVVWWKIVPVVLALLATPAHSLTWTLQNVQFGTTELVDPGDEGGGFIITPIGTATGSFEYFADTDSFGAVNIVTAGTGVFDGLFDQAFANELDPSEPQRIRFVTSAEGDQDGDPILNFDFIGADFELPMSGGTFPLALLGQSNISFCIGPCSDDARSFGISVVTGSVTANTVTAGAVPIPGSFVLLLSGMVAAGVAARARRV